MTWESYNTDVCGMTLLCSAVQTEVLHFKDAQVDSGFGGITWAYQGVGFGLLCFCLSSLVFPI